MKTVTFTCPSLRSGRYTMTTVAKVEWKNPRSDGNHRRVGGWLVTHVGGFRHFWSPSWGEVLLEVR